MKNGVPYKHAFSMSEGERLAHVAVFAQFEGNEWDWANMTVKRK